MARALAASGAFRVTGYEVALTRPGPERTGQGDDLLINDNNIRAFIDSENQKYSW